MVSILVLYTNYALKLSSLCNVIRRLKSIIHMATIGSPISPGRDGNINVFFITLNLTD